ncbi:MAG: hypothetical protein ACTSU2_04075 [Promethearchaeota archaeon]
MNGHFDILVHSQKIHDELVEMSEQIEKMFEKLTNNLPIELEKHLTFNELTPEQDKIVQLAMDVFKENIVGDIKKFGGKVNDEEFKKLEDELKKRLENPIFKPYVKDMEKLIEKWKKLKKEELNNIVFAFAPVKQLPFKTVSFLTVPRILWSKGKIDKMQINKNAIAFSGEIEAIVTRTVLYGKMIKEEPLFAPHIGQLDLADYKPDPNEKGAKSENPRFIREIIDSLDRKTTKNQVMRYHDQYERHGEPICDFLMKDDDLKKSLSKLSTAIETKRQSSGAAIGAIVVPLINTSIVIVVDESSGSKKYEIAFEALIKLGAACYETPNVKKGPQLAQAQAAAMTRANSQAYSGGQGIGSMVPQRPPSTPQLPVWTEEELAEEMKKRGTAPPPNLPVWTEEELEKEAKKRGGALNLPVWTEEELEQEKKRRQGAFNIPEWKEDNNTINCPKCGYACRPNWGTCPICGAPLNVKTPQKPPAPQGQKPPAPQGQKPPAPQGQKPPAPQGQKPLDKK